MAHCSLLTDTSSNFNHSPYPNVHAEIQSVPSTGSSPEPRQHGDVDHLGTTNGKKHLTRGSTRSESDRLHMIGSTDAAQVEFAAVCKLRCSELGLSGLELL